MYQRERDFTFGETTIHLLLTNNTFFLVDYFVYSNLGFYVLYPKQASEVEPKIIINITAYNDFTSNFSLIQLNWNPEKIWNSYPWFIGVVSILGAALLILICFCFQKV